MEKMEWKQIDSITFESQTPCKFDFVITSLPGDTSLDIFDSSIADKDKAYIETIACDNLEAAKEEAELYLQDKESPAAPVASEGNHVYALGDKWRKGFDIAGMLKMAQQADLSWGKKRLTLLYNSLSDMNFHAYAGLLWNIIQHMNDEEMAKKMLEQFREELSQSEYIMAIGGSVGKVNHQSYGIPAPYTAVDAEGGVIDYSYLQDPEYKELSIEYDQVLAELNQTEKRSAKRGILSAKLDRIQNAKKRIALGSARTTALINPIETKATHNLNINRFSDGGELSQKIKLNNLYLKWNKIASSLLVGKEIYAASYMTAAEADRLGWDVRTATESCLVIQFTDGSIIYPSRDDEGNDSGFFELSEVSDESDMDHGDVMAFLSRCKVTSVAYMPQMGVAANKWHSSPLVITVQGHGKTFSILPVADPEGNDGGAIFGIMDKKEIVLPVI